MTAAAGSEPPTPGDHLPEGGRVTDLEADRLARACLSRLGEPGDPRLLRLVRELGAVTVCEHLLADRDVGEGLARDVAGRRRGLDPAGELERAERHGIRFVIPGDAEWPVALDDLGHLPTLQERGDVPLGLWVRGPLRLDEWPQRSVAVVGSRSATSYGTDTAAEMAAVIAGEGFAVISGAALGIDQAAHRGALARHGATIAVLASGVDRPYPMRNAALIDSIALRGAVVSEAPPGSQPLRVRFLARNRLIAALSLGTVVVEAAQRSGSLSTLNWAQALSRVTLGVPGPITSATSVGVHRQIRQGGATLVTSGAEVLEALGTIGEHLIVEPVPVRTPRDRLTVRERQLLDAFPPLGAIDLGELVTEAGMAQPDVTRALERLIRLGLVRESGRGWSMTSAALR